MQAAETPATTSSSSANTTSPYFTTNADQEARAEDTKMEDDTLPSLANSSAQDRQEHYRKVYDNKVQRLSHIEAPGDCDFASPQSDEIFEAYLRYTTFIVKVTVNYDPVARRFYNATDQRYKTCGTIVLTPSQKHNIETTVTPNSEFGKIRFELASAWAKLAEVTFCAEPSKLDVGCDITYSGNFLIRRSEHVGFVDDLEEALKQICESFSLPYGRHGFTLKEVKQMAKHFRREQTEEDVQAYDWNPDTSDWTEVDNNRENNTGYINVHGYGGGGSGGFRQRVAEEGDDDGNDNFTEDRLRAGGVGLGSMRGG